MADRSNVERVVRAVAIGRNSLADMGYVLFDSELLAAAEIGAVAEAGRTADEGANAWHRDLVDLSGNKLVTLTKAILENGETGTILRKRLRELVEEGIREKQLPEKCRSKLKQ